MARFFKTKSGVHVNVDRVSRVRVKEASDGYNEKPFFVQFVFENFTEGVGHDSREEAETELAAFLEFANGETVETVSDRPEPGAER